MNNVLCIQNLSVSVKGQALVQNISFDICESEAILLSGANGVGKSTVLKAILQVETEGKRFTGQIVERSFGDVISLKQPELQHYRRSIAYVPQKDEYAEMGNIQVRDIISESSSIFSGKSLSISEVNDLIDFWLPPQAGKKRVFDAKSKPAKFSGGEQRLLSVLSIVATRSSSELLIIDEPLNNLDFTNAGNVSNLLNRVIQENPKTALLMISHCRIFPFITREVMLTPNGISTLPEHYVCHSCIGEPDESGFYV